MRDPQPGEPYLGSAHRYIAVVNGDQGRFTTLEAALHTAKILATSNSEGWLIQDTRTGTLWTSETLERRVAG